jgi:serine/threonine-protein kinase
LAERRLLPAAWYMNTVPAALASALADRYRLEREVGQGGMATVYLAQDLKHDRRVAIKVLREDVAELIGATRFLREIRLTASLDHPHILALLDSGEIRVTSRESEAGKPSGTARDSRLGTVLYYVMPYVEGESLRDRLRREGTIELADALRIAREVADALDYAHARGIIHRDIKPENILLAAGHARVADFGIARAVSGAGDTNTQVTQVGLVVGTPAYMSPEQAVGESGLDGRSDLYSLGCVLYEMITGAAPFAGTAAQAMLVRRFRETPAPLRNARPQASGELEGLVMRLLSTDPAGRHASASELTRALQAATASRTGESAAATPTASPAASRSVAVLPVVNMSADPENEYFSDGMTEELISVLTRTAGLRVAARSSVFAYKGRSEDVRVVGRALNVDTVLTGSVRKAGSRIRLVAQLTTVADGYQVWSDTFDRELSDVFAVQDELAQAIAGALKVRLAPAAAPAGGRQGTENVEAYTHYLRGRFHWGRRTEADILKGLEHFQQALTLDPDYALAEIGVADSYNIMGFYDWMHPREAFPRALAAANRALALDDSLAAAYSSRGYVRLYHEWQWAASEEDFRRAESMAPNYATASHCYGNLLVQQGRFAEADAAMRRAVASEPLSMISNAAIGWAMYYAGRFDAAIAQYHSTIELDPTFALAHLWLGYALIQVRRFDDAIREFETALRLTARSAIAVAALARAHMAAGRRAEADVLLAELERLGQQRFVPQYDIASIFAAAGDRDAAFARLSRAVADREHEVVLLAVDPAMTGLRDDPRYAALARQIGL